MILPVSYRLIFSSVFATVILFLTLETRLDAQQSTDNFQDAEQQYAYAVGLSERKFYDLAAEQFLAFVRTHSDSERAPQAWEHLIDCYNRLGRSRETEEAVAEFRRRWPNSAQLGKLDFLEGDSRYRRGDYENAAGCFARAARNDDATLAEAAKYFLSQCLEKMGQPAESRKLLEELAGKALENGMDYRFYALYQLAVKALSAGNREEAETSFQKLLQSLVTPADIRKECLWAYANLMFSRGDYKASRTTSESFIQEFPEEARIREVMRLRLKSCHYLKDDDLVVRLAADFSSRYPDDKDYEVEMIHASSLTELRRYADALELYRHLSQNPEVPERFRSSSLQNAITCLMVLKRHQELIEMSGEFLEKYPNSTAKGEVLFRRGNAMLALGQLEEAITPLSESLEAFVGDRENFVTAGLLLVECHKRRNDWAAASRVLHRIIPSMEEEQRKEYWGEIVNLALRMEDYELAQKEICEVLRLWPEDNDMQSRFLDSLFRVQFKLNQLTEARKTLEKRSQIVDWRTFQEVSYWLSQIARQQHDIPVARTYLEESVKKVQQWEEGGARNLLILIQLEIQNGLKDKATEHLAVVSDWSDEQLTGFVSARLLTSFGEFYTEGLKYHEAERFLRLAVNIAQEPPAHENTVKSLVQLLLQLKRTDEAGELLQNVMNDYGDQASAELRSMLAELCLEQKKYDQALMLSDAILRQPPYNDQRTLARSQWVKAVVLFEDEHDAKNALPLCLKNYVMLDDEFYTPKSMELAIRLWLDLQKKEEAAAVWEEMKQRFPVRAAAIRDQEFLKKLN